MNTKKVAVIGAGPAGMMAAYYSAINNADVTVFEKNDKVGKKLFITGKGRCNITNSSDMENIFANIVTNKKFLYSALYSYTNDDVMNFFENEGLKLKVERGNRVFPLSDHSSDVINTLKKSLKNQGVKIEYNTDVNDLIVKDNEVSGVVLSDGSKQNFDKVIIATGGISYPVTGSDGKGMKIIEKYGHTITDLRPALVPMNVLEEFAKDLQGLSLKNISVNFYEEGRKKPIYSEFGEMLFTHFGVSGPVILSASSTIGKKLKNNNIILKIDLKPALNESQLDERILRDFSECINKDFRNALDKLIPKKLISVIIDYCKIDPYKKVNTISKEERQSLIKALKEFTMTITSLRGFNEAIITSGGIDVKEINPTTMESKIVKNLYIAGEMIDVDAYTGGYNLQIAWSTGKLAGESAAM
ncbi:MAG: NAD(P)/FAD-dependent oxidoreductase [Lachnospiraceae bacterium]|nr:NAD(P)/FAD-dependent oxidoreductase [Lachnospiraceae bacterium]